MASTSNTRMLHVQDAVSPEEVISLHPITNDMEDQITSARAAISNVLSGIDNRMIVVSGPCSIHNKESALEYARWLKDMQSKHDQLLLVMRVYFEKPRTTVGWKGLVKDPHLDGSCDVNTGLKLARQIMWEIANMGVPIATEQLDVFTPQYWGDLISWAAIGARSTENQGHREMASGLSTPVGFKNGTDGSTKTAIDAIIAARESHVFMAGQHTGENGIFTTAGNHDSHIILRGGGGRRNYDEDSVLRVAADMRDRELDPKIVVDASHANAPGGYREQLTVVDEIARMCRNGSQLVRGIMLESHLKAGKQGGVTPGSTPVEQILPDQSITDACIGLDETQQALDTLQSSLGSIKAA